MSDLNLDEYRSEKKKINKKSDLSSLNKSIKQCALSVGFDADEKNRSGTFLQIDDSIIYNKSLKEGVEVLPVSKALKKYSWLKDYYWKIIPEDSDKYTKEAANTSLGYFIRASKGVKLTIPVQSCLLMSQGGIQNIHNIIIAEEGSELNLITGCNVTPHIKKGIHIGVSEFFVKKDAKISFTMLHSWSPHIHSRPRSAALVEENGLFMSTYACLKPVKSLQMYPKAILAGKKSIARFHSILLGLKDSVIDVGARTILKNKNCRTEITSRAISKDSSRIIARGDMIAEEKKTKGHLDCRGLVLSKDSSIKAVPELDGIKGCDLSHEAAVGDISAEQLWYLMSRGFTKDEATSLIVRGFFDVSIPELPNKISNDIKKIINMTAEESF